MKKDFKEKAVRFLQDLVSIESCVINHGLNGKEERIQNFIAKKLIELGCKVEKQNPDNQLMSSSKYFTPGHCYEKRPNVTGVLKGSGSGKTLLMNGHVDAMPVGDIKLWGHDPFGAEIVGDKLYGNGAVDMKAGVAAMIMAVQLLQEKGVELPGDIILQSVVDEEGGGNGTLDAAMRGIKADAALILEPNELTVDYGHMGCLLLEIAVSGKSIHACMRDRGVNAIDKMMPFYNALKELEKKWGENMIQENFPVPALLWVNFMGEKRQVRLQEKLSSDVISILRLTRIQRMSKRKFCSYWKKYQIPLSKKLAPNFISMSIRT